jgi:hypothetical protein
MRRLPRRQSFRASAILALAALIATASGRASGRVVAQQPGPLPPPVELTAKEDHQRLLDLLKIPSLRPGPSGNPQAPNAANVDESKANPYPTLPDPLVLKNKRKVTTPSCGPSAASRSYSLRNATTGSMRDARRAGR